MKLKRNKRMSADARKHMADWPDKWPGQVWGAWAAPENDSSTPDYFLVTERGNIDLPIALVTIIQDADPQKQAQCYANALNCAVNIARNPKTVDVTNGLPVENLRMVGRPDCPHPAPDHLFDLGCVALADRDGSVEHPQPYCRFRFARLLRQHIKLAFTAGELAKYRHHVASLVIWDAEFDGSETRHVDLDTGVTTMGP